MAFANVNLGSRPDDGTGDPLRVAFGKINQNFANISAGDIVLGGDISGNSLTITGNMQVGTLGTSVHNILGNLVLGDGGATASADSILTINLNDTPPIAQANNAVHLNGADGRYSWVGADSFGANVYPAFYGRSARGTCAAPTSTRGGDVLVALKGKGYGPSGFSNSLVSGSGVRVAAIENFTGSSQATQVVLSAIPTGLITPVDVVRVLGEGVGITTSTTSTSIGTGALVVTGGVGIGGNVCIQDKLFVGGNASDLDISRQIIGAPVLIRGTSGSGAFTQYTALSMINTTNTGSADFAAYSDNGDTTSGWADMGMSGSTFNDPAYTITKPNDGYFFVQGKNTDYGGNLVLATGSAGFQNDIIIGLGGFDENDEVARFHKNIGTGQTLFSLIGNISANLNYTMGNSQNWTSSVTTVGAALDQLAARLKLAGF